MREPGEDDFDLPTSKSDSMLEDYLGVVCSTCGRKKRIRESFCRICYARLPRDMQNALYRRFGCGYEEAFAQAKEYIGVMRRP